MSYVRVPFVLLALAGLSACDGGPGAALAPESAAVGASATVAASSTGEPTPWSTMSASDLWAHVAALDSPVLVGLKEPGQRRGIDNRGRVLVPAHQWTPFAHRVEALGVELLYVDDFHPLVKLRLTGQGQIEALRRSPFVEYVEPASFDTSDVLMSSGCASSSSSAPIEIYGSPQSPGDIVPGTLTRHQIPEAWQFSTGAGNTIGIVDTGTSVYQPQLQQEFARFEVFHKGGSGPFTYTWGTGETSKWILLNIDVHPGVDYTITVSGSVTGENGIMRAVSKDVLVHGNGGLGTG